MAAKEDLHLFEAAVRNSREAAAAVNIFRQRVNTVLCKGSSHEIQIYTRLHALMFCVWAEAEHLRLVYTPYGFSSSEIREVLRQRSVEDRWKKILEIGLGRTQLDPNGSMRRQFGPRLERLIQEFIVGPAQLRNKIAHGQWIEAFNGESSALNAETRQRLALLDVIEVDRWHFVFKRLSLIVEDSIESPQRAFRRDTWTRIAEVEAGLQRMRTWTVESKVEKLKSKRRIAH
jgi:hypothetical protein